MRFGADKKFIVIVAGLAVIVLLAVSAGYNDLMRILEPRASFPISDFAGCLAAGYPVFVGPPRVCVSPNGERFVHEGALIRLFEPLPHARITSPLVIAGEARGSWFFEATFPIRLVDHKGNVLATGVAQAQGPWMTEDFVPFAAQLSFIAAPGDTGTLIFENDNPSGDPVKLRSFAIPVKF